MWIKLISIWKASHLDSLWNRGERQLGNRLMKYIWPLDISWRIQSTCQSLRTLLARNTKTTTALWGQAHIIHLLPAKAQVNSKNSKNKNKLHIRKQHYIIWASPQTSQRSNRRDTFHILSGELHRPVQTWLAADYFGMNLISSTKEMNPITRKSGIVEEFPVNKSQSNTLMDGRPRRCS